MANSRHQNHFYVIKNVYRVYKHNFLIYIQVKSELECSLAALTIGWRSKRLTLGTEINFMSLKILIVSFNDIF